MKTIKRGTVIRLFALLLAIALPVGLPAAALPGGLISQPVTVTQSGGIMYEDDWVKVEYAEDLENIAQSEDLMLGANATGSISMILPVSTILATQAANLTVTLSGRPLPNGTVTVYLWAGGQKRCVTPVVNNTAAMVFTAAQTNITPGTYYIRAESEDGVIAQAPIDVLTYDTRIWSPSMRPDTNGNTVVVFLEPISISPNKYSVTINGVTQTSSPGDMSIVINYPYDSLKANDKIVLSGIKYPRLYPSYSYTFTITYTPGGRYSLPLLAGNTYYLDATVFQSQNPGTKTYTLTYNPAMLELVDATAQTEFAYITANAEAGIADGAGVTILTHTNGVLTFKTSRPETSFSGVLTLLKLKAKASGETVITIR